MATARTDYSSGVISSAVALPPSGDIERKIHLREAGSRPSHPEPTVVFVCGLGSGCLSYTVVQHELARAGIYSIAHDRLGNGRSSPLPTFGDPDKPDEEKPKPRNAEKLAQELDEMLRAASIPPPYILVSHSYGGVITWEYVAAHAKNVDGLVFLDANSARSAERPVMGPDLEVLNEGLEEGELDYAEVVGLNAASRLPSELWEEAMDKRDPPEGWPKGTGGGSAEAQAYYESCPALRRHKLTERHPLGNLPVTVIKGDTESDIRKLIDAARRLGGGTKEARDELSRKLDGASIMEEDQQRDHLQLTATGTRRFIDTKKSGHWIHVTEPELVVEEIKRMVNEVKEQGLIDAWART